MSGPGDTWIPLGWYRVIMFSSVFLGFSANVIALGGHDDLALLAFFPYMFLFIEAGDSHAHWAWLVLGFFSIFLGAASVGNCVFLASYGDRPAGPLSAFLVMTHGLSLAVLALGILDHTRGATK